MATYVTRPYLPPLNEFIPYLEEIWSSRTLTNGGPMHQRLERALEEYLDVEHVSLFVNATIALVTALQALKVTGEVITTPFSFVATAHALLWNGLKPVFVDIQPDSLNIDPERIEAAITPATSAILAVHVYGRPADTAKIQAIAERHGLRIIYDAAHAFGPTDLYRNLLAQGDMSVLSFHATKVFNTFEGGAIITRSPSMKTHVDRLKNFGFVDETTIVEAGINGKMNEFCAALGLAQLAHMPEVLRRRAAAFDNYLQSLQSVDGLTLPTRIGTNSSYFPILVTPAYHRSRDQLYQRLRSHDIFARRYFHPLISEHPMYRMFASSQPDNLPVATRIAGQVLCLPIHPELADSEIARIASIIRSK